MLNRAGALEFIGLVVRISGLSLRHGRGKRATNPLSRQRSRQPLALLPLQSSVPAQEQLSPSKTPIVRGKP